uniref:Uncharacterized protein n=1 Tax=Trichobilharzia regenti TaxID=157069 RepID=A0AA85K755_TRIRE|nr:unnamed protein product [Trichobilharzia regenti]
MVRQTYSAPQEQVNWYMHVEVAQCDSLSFTFGLNSFLQENVSRRLAAKYVFPSDFKRRLRRISASISPLNSRLSRSIFFGTDWTCSEVFLGFLDSCL